MESAALAALRPASDAPTVRSTSDTRALRRCPASVVLGPLRRVLLAGSNTVRALLMLDGTATVRHHETLHLDPRMVLWLTAESTLWLLRDSERSFAALISFSEDQIREQTGAADMLLTSDVVLRRALPRSHARSLLPVLRDIAAQRAEVADSGLRYLLARLWEQAGIDQTHLRQSTINPIVQRAVRALEQDPTLGATELAHLAGMSYKHLARLFKVELGEGPTQVRQKIRIDRFMVEYSASKNLLESALAAGFGSYPQFYRVFRRHTGLNPRAYFRSGRSCLSELPAGGPSAGIVSGLGTSTPEA